jgi:hypothetical protein
MATDRIHLRQSFLAGIASQASLSAATPWPGSLHRLTVKAKIAYNDFFALWKGADPDLPLLNEAGAEYARLQ